MQNLTTSSLDTPKFYYKTTLIFLLIFVFVALLLYSIFSLSTSDTPKKVNFEWLLSKFQGSFNSDIFLIGIKDAIKNIDNFNYDSLGVFSGLVKFFASGARFSLFFFSLLLTAINFIVTSLTLIFTF